MAIPLQKPHVAGGGTARWGPDLKPASTAVGGRLGTFCSRWRHVFLHVVMRTPEDHGAESVFRHPPGEEDTERSLSSLATLQGGNKIPEARGPGQRCRRTYQASHPRPRGEGRGQGRT